MTTDLDRFRRAVMADPALQQQLLAIDNGEAFVAAAVAAAASLGIALDSGGLAAALMPDPLGLSRYATLAATMIDWPGADWLPVDLVATPDGPGVKWLSFAGLPLTDPFFEQTLRAARRRPLNRLDACVTPLAVLTQAAPVDARLPDGLVFHLSRCGSTLVAQMIAAIPDARVVSEAPIIDQIVQLATMYPDLAFEQHVVLLRGVVRAFGRVGRGAFVVKLDSWHTLALPLFRAAFPDVPWVFLLRDPVEILVSQLRQRGMQTVPGALPPSVYGIDDAFTMPTEEYCARVLARVCDGVLDHDATGGLVVDYATLPEAVERLILPHFGIVSDSAARAALALAGTRDAKAPRQSFTADRATKQAAASDAIRTAAARHLATRYRLLRARSVTLDAASDPA